MGSNHFSSSEQELHNGQDTLEKGNRIAAAGVVAQNARTREFLLGLKKTAKEGEGLHSLNEKQVMAHGSLLGISIKNKKVEEVADELADALLQDMECTVPSQNGTLDAVAPPERKLVWNNIGVTPAGPVYEVDQASRQVVGETQDTQGKMVDQFLRLGIAFSMNSVASGSIAQDCLLGLPQRATIKANPGALRDDTINIALNANESSLAAELIKVMRTAEVGQMAEEAGARGIQLYGLSCSEPLSENHIDGVIPLSNARLSQPVIATGALDLWLATPQDILPDMLDAARCLKTVVVVTSESGCLPGVEYLGQINTQENAQSLEELARRIVFRAVESYKNRRDICRIIPPSEIEAMVNFNRDTLEQRYGCMSSVSSAMINKKIQGIANITGCSRYSFLPEEKLSAMIDILLENNILIFTSGCISSQIVKMGYCSSKSVHKCGSKLQEFLGTKMPPVWHFSNCLDNIHLVFVFREIAKYTGRPIKSLPLAQVIPQCFNEKEFCTALAYRTLGLNSYHCEQSAVRDASDLVDFLPEETKDLLGSSITIDADPEKLAEKIVADFDQARSDICWR